MARARQKPTRTGDSQHYEYAENHPAYAMIGASRVTVGDGPGGESLFGSDFMHRNYVVIRVVPATLRRGISNDWYGSNGRRDYIEVAVSEAQWASFVSTMNVGDGVPATLQHFNGEEVPGIEPITNRRAQLNSEIGDTLADTVAHLDALDAAIEATPGASGKSKAALRESLRRARQELVSNLPYVSATFDKHAEATVERAKAEVDAWVTSAIQRAGLKALGAEPIIELHEVTE